MEECSAELWACGGRDEIGCISSASDSEDDLYLPYHHDDSLECQAPLAGDHPDRPGGAASAADAVADDTSTRQFCCCSLAPLEHQTQLICEQLLSRGWHCHPAEIVPGASTFSPDGRGRPEAGRRVDFSNSAHHSAGYLFSDDPCEALFDRLQLAGLTRGTDICPLTVCLRGGPSGWGQLEVQQQLAAVGDAPGGGCVFLKENFEHFGTGTRVFSSVAEALAALASELAEGDRQQTQDFVLQPHVPRASTNAVAPAKVSRARLGAVHRPAVHYQAWSSTSLATRQRHCRRGDRPVAAGRNGTNFAGDVKSKPSVRLPRVGDLPGCPRSHHSKRDKTFKTARKLVARAGCTPTTFLARRLGLHPRRGLHCSPP